MKARNVNLIVFALSCLTVLSLAGSSLGTLAWYAYSTRAVVEYRGTAVQKTEQLQIGLRWGPKTKPDDAEFMTRYELERVEAGDDAYYFMPAGTGFTMEACTEYLQKTGSAYNEIVPVTTREYATGGDLALWEAPMAQHENDFARASSNYYVTLPLAFRVFSSTAIGEKIPNQKVWLTDVSASVLSEGKDVTQSLRIHTVTSDNQKFILNPTADAEGDTYVAGVLDLDKDGYYDFDRIGDMHEFLYGDITGTKGTTAINDVAFSSLPGYEDSGKNVDINGTGVTAQTEEARSTFYARHNDGAVGYSNYVDGSDVRKKAHYVDFDYIKPATSGTTFSGGRPIVTTSNDEDAIGFATLTAYVEGWDHSIIDSNIGATFGLGLQFEINRVS